MDKENVSYCVPNKETVRVTAPLHAAQRYILAMDGPLEEWALTAHDMWDERHMARWDPWAERRRNPLHVQYADDTARVGWGPTPQSVAHKAIRWQQTLQTCLRRQTVAQNDNKLQMFFFSTLSCKCERMAEDGE